MSSNHHAVPVEPRALLQEAVHICVVDLVLMTQKNKAVLGSDVERLVRCFCDNAAFSVEKAPKLVRDLYHQAIAKPNQIFPAPNVAAAFGRAA